MTQEQTLAGFAARLMEWMPGWAAKRNGLPFGLAPWPDLALELFRLQFHHNPVYRRLCTARQATPARVEAWTDIPALPVAAFKEFEVTALPPEQRAACFLSSGTTGQERSRHFHSAVSLALYQASVLPWFRRFFPSGPGPVPAVLFLTPGADQAPASSLAHMFEIIRRESGGGPDSFCGRVAGDGGWELDPDRVLEQLARAQAEGGPVWVFGTAFLFVHLADLMEARGLGFTLPAGSAALETGGYKGRSRALPKPELHALIARRLGLPPGQIVTEYGMSELSSQAYDRPFDPPDRPGLFRFPPWARARVISPETGLEAAPGETGLIQVFDLANVFSVMALQTEDLGILHPQGLELIGRAPQAEPRGCSLMTQ